MCASARPSCSFRTPAPEPEVRGGAYVLPPAPGPEGRDGIIEETSREDSTVSTGKKSLSPGFC